MFDWSNHYLWGALLLVAFPALTIALAEIAHRMGGETDGQTFRKPVLLLRYSVLPLGFVAILLHEIVGVPSSHLAVKVIDTAFAIVLLNAAIAFFNGVVFRGGSLVAGRYRVPSLLLDVVRFVLVLCGAAIVVSRVWDADLSSLVAALGVGSIVIGLALQDTLSSLFAGIAMVSSRQFGVGDWISFGGDEGQIVAMDWRSVKIRAATGAVMFIPNSIIAKQQVKALGGVNGPVLATVEIKAPYDAPPDQVSRLIADAARQTAGFHQTPPPVARITGFGSDGISYAIGVRVLDYGSIGAVRGEFLANLWYLAQRRGLVFAGQAAAPTVTLAMAPPAPSDEVARLTDRLAAVGGLGLSRERMAQLVAHARLERYRGGEMIVDPDAADDHVFVLIEGRALAVFRDDDGQITPLHEFGRGDLLMARSMFRATRLQFGLKAIEDALTMAIPAADFRAARAANPTLARDIEQLALARDEMAKQALRKAFPDQQEALDLTDRARILREMFRT